MRWIFAVLLGCLPAVADEETPELVFDGQVIDRDWLERLTETPAIGSRISNETDPPSLNLVTITDYGTLGRTLSPLPGSGIGGYTEMDKIKTSGVVDLTGVNWPFAHAEGPWQEARPWVGITAQSASQTLVVIIALGKHRVPFQMELYDRDGRYLDSWGATIYVPPHWEEAACHETPNYGQVINVVYDGMKELQDQLEGDLWFASVYPMASNVASIAAELQCANARGELHPDWTASSASPDILRPAFLCEGYPPKPNAIERVIAGTPCPLMSVTWDWEVAE